MGVKRVKFTESMAIRSLITESTDNAGNQFLMIIMYSIWNSDDHLIPFQTNRPTVNLV